MADVHTPICVVAPIDQPIGAVFQPIYEQVQPVSILRFNLFGQFYTGKNADEVSLGLKKVSFAVSKVGKPFLPLPWSISRTSRIVSLLPIMPSPPFSWLFALCYYFLEYDENCHISRFRMTVSVSF